MIVALGMRPINGPWGGGNQFIKNFSKYLENEKVKVVYDLLNENIDIILIIDPRKKKYQDSISIDDAINYRLKINKKVKIILRVNECDERKNTNNINRLFMDSSKISDVTVFVSDWLLRLYENHGLNSKNRIVIRSGADSNIFKPIKNKIPPKKLKIITHHWSYNQNKGMKIYKMLDKYLGITELKDNFSFEYVGNKPKLLFFKNSDYSKPIHGENLANKLRESHIYLTASLNEPAGMHFIEGLSCGLPVLYVNSGGTTEYCKNYGLEFDENNLIEKLFLMKKEYLNFQKKINKFQFVDELMNKSYFNLFKSIINGN